MVKETTFFLRPVLRQVEGLDIVASGDEHTPPPQHRQERQVQAQLHVEHAGDRSRGGQPWGDNFMPTHREIFSKYY